MCTTAKIHLLPDFSENVSSLDSHLGFWLRFVSNCVSGNFQKLIEMEGVSVSEWVVLRQLFNKAESTTEDLIKALGMTKGAISKMVTSLQKKGFAKRIVLEIDKRAIRISLTYSGRLLVPKLASVADQNDKVFFGHFSSNKRTEITDLIKKIVQRHQLKKFQQNENKF